MTSKRSHEPFLKFSDWPQNFLSGPEIRGPVQELLDRSKDFRLRRYQHLQKRPGLIKSPGGGHDSIIQKKLKINIFSDSLPVIRHTLTKAKPYFAMNVDNFPDNSLMTVNLDDSLVRLHELCCLNFIFFAASPK